MKKCKVCGGEPIQESLNEVLKSTYHPGWVRYMCGSCYRCQLPYSKRASTVRLQWDMRNYKK